MTTSPPRSRGAPARRLVKLGSSRAIGDAGHLREELLGLLRRKSAITLDASELERIDTASLQVLLAFHRTASKRGITVKWKSPSAAARATMALVGASTAFGLAAEEPA